MDMKAKFIMAWKAHDKQVTTMVANLLLRKENDSRTKNSSVKLLSRCFVNVLKTSDVVRNYTIWENYA